MTAALEKAIESNGTYTVDQVAALLSCSNQTVRRMKIPGVVKIGKRAVRFHRRIVNQWIAAGCKPVRGN